VTVTDYGAIVAALRAVPGVCDADVEPGDDGEGLGLLRVGLDPGADEVQVASNVGRVLRDQFGLGVDADAVQLVEDAETAAAPAPSSARPVISRMQLVSAGLEVTATVLLTFRDLEVAGDSTGTATQTGVLRAVATATVRALEQLISGQARFEIDQVAVSMAGPSRAVLVAVTMVSGSGSEHLTGAATVREDVRQATIRATLDALNRRLEPLLP
jgi:hypothetical protein